MMKTCTIVPQNKTPAKRETAFYGRMESDFEKSFPFCHANMRVCPRRNLQRTEVAPLEPGKRCD